MALFAVIILTMIVFIGTVVGILLGSSVRTRGANNAFTVISPLAAFLAFLVAAISCDGSLRFVFAFLTAALFGVFYKWAMD